MTQVDVEGILIEVIGQLQEQSGRAAVQIVGGTCPIMDVPGFDSLNGVEATVEILDRLKLDLDLNNVFVEDDSALTVKQAATRLVARVSEK